MSFRKESGTLLPKKLKENATIGIVAPSYPILPEHLAELKPGEDFLADLGFKLVFAKNYLNNKLGYGNTPEEKADDINNMFLDKKIDAILCAQGGNSANSVLPFIKWDIIKANPKIFMGISDITVLLNTIYQKTGLITFHGNDSYMWGIYNSAKAYDKTEFLNRLVHGKKTITKLASWKTIRPGVAKGKLMGGNLNCILKLAGTKYFPDFSNSILFLEAYETTPEICFYLFHQMKQTGVFEKIKGVVIGYIYGLEHDKSNPYQMEDILLEVTKEYTFPILKINEFGHCCSNTVLPVGAEAHLDADKQIFKIS
ncbi:LD-carboxypeptidase, partial [bacterium]|nr:LD-carboxypeptidase [bacterium]